MPERADAARNRQKVLDAARELIASRGVEDVTVDEVARAAGVAKGTVFSRFGDRSGLIAAVVGDHERILQEAIIRGRPPLGPGAPALERLTAFVDALAELTDEHADLLIQVDASRYRTGAYAAWRQHVALLLREIGRDDELLPDIVLAPLAPDVVRHLRRDRGVPLRDLKAALRDSVEKLAG